MLSAKAFDAFGIDFLCFGLRFVIFWQGLFIFIFEQGFLMPLTDF